ncbi:ATP/GTP-binding protein [Nitrospira sp.]|nr:ATP/GTP-binding protein [Nitrospira sp.]
MTFHHKHASRQSRTRHGSRGLATGLLLVLGWCALSTEVGALQVLELLEPYSFVVDTDSKAYFISSVNGDETARDNNGFITKMDEAGTVVQLKFIAGGQNGHTLHAPKGLAIVGRTLYVVDLDQLKGYDKTTGQLLVTVPLGSGAAPQAGPPSQLMDVVTDGHGLLFVSDRTRDTIYRIAIAKNHQVSILIHNPGLAGPAGIALHPRGDRLVVVSWDKGKIVEVGFDGALTELVSNGFFSSRFGNLSGVDFDQWGNMYVSDFTRGKIWRMQPDQKFQVIAEYLPSPADIAIDRSNHVILVPYHYGNAAEVNGLESPIKKGGTKRTLSDYGFAPPPSGKDSGAK